VEVNKRLFALISCLLLVLGVIALGSNNPKLAPPRSIALPAEVILDQESAPLVAESGKIGFITSAVDGSLISFNAGSGKLLSSVVVGQGAGGASMVEIGGRRLIAVPCTNDPGKSQAATVSIVDATKARDLQILSLLMLPVDAQITPSTQALLTSDGRFALIASSFENPTLFSFSLETGQVVSTAQVVGRPSQIALKDTGPEDTARIVAVASSIANAVTIIGVNEQGVLIVTATFSPPGATFDGSNNAAFGQDGKTLYVAAAASDRLFAVDSATGAQISAIGVDSPERLTAAPRPGGDGDVLAVTRIRRPASGKPAGATVVISTGGQLATKADFNLPDQIEMARPNNIVFARDPAVAFLSSASGFLFAFNPDTGEKVADMQLSGEAMRMSISPKSQTLAVVNRTKAGDQVVVVQFDLSQLDAAGGSGDAAAPATDPAIESLSPSTVRRGQLRDVPLAIRGANFPSGSSLVLNGAQLNPGLVRNVNTIVAKLPRSLFDKSGEVTVQVKSPAGPLSRAAVIRVVESDAAPVINTFKPAGVPTSTSFTIRVTGTNFSSSSVLFLNNVALNTTVSPDMTRLSAHVPAKLTRTPGQLSMQVKDSAAPDLVSNVETVTAFGPSIATVLPQSDPIAGAGSVKLTINGQYFSSQVNVRLNEDSVPAARVQVVSDSVIKASVPGRFVQSAVAIPVTVTNSDGNISNAVSFDALGPKISSVEPGQVAAGVSSAKVVIHGQNFRVHSKVLVSAGSATATSQFSVQFACSARVVVLLKGASAATLLSKTGNLNLQVVNPNSETGVPSTPMQLQLVGPSVTGMTIAAGSDSTSVITISGQFFRNSAQVQFLKSGQVVLRRVPDRVTKTQILLTLSNHKLAGLDQFQVQVVNPGGILSAPFPDK